MTLKIDQPGFYPDIDEKEYHADPVEAGSLSSTMANKILKTPAHLRHYLDTPQPQKDEYDFGNLVHAGILGKGQQVKILDFDAFRSNEAKAARDKAIEEGFIPYKKKDYWKIQAAIDAVKNHPIAGALFDDDLERNEVSAFAQHPSGVWLRGRYDRLTETGIILDLKTARDADPMESAKVAYNFGQDTQAAHYSLIYELITGQPPRGFIHVNVEKEAPNLVSVTQLDPEFLEMGRAKAERAIARYAYATQNNHWPGYPSGIQSISPKPWMVYEEEDLQEKEETNESTQSAA